MPLKLTDTTDHTAAGFAAERGRAVALYADGGVLVKNPSPYGGTFAVRLVDAAGVCLIECSGAVAAPEVAPLPWVSNNLTEVTAIVLGLELLPDGWSGMVYTDSKTALKRCRDCLSQACPNWLPADLWGRLYAARRRLGDLRFVLLSGHPTADELLAGKSRKGRPVSIHNVEVDNACGDQAKRLLAKLKVDAAAEAVPPARAA